MTTDTYPGHVMVTPQEAAELGLRDGNRNIRHYEALARNKKRCCNCDNPVWKLMDLGMCFPCTTGETDASGDYELMPPPKPPED